MLLWLGETVLSDDLSAESGKQPVAFRKLKNCCWNEEINESVCFSGRFDGETIQLLLQEKTSFAIRPQCPGSQNTCFSAFSEL